MRVNDWALLSLSTGNGTMEGRLQHRKLGSNISQGFKERWFKLKYNILFYFNLNEMGQVVDSKPAGALVVENCTAAYEMASDAAFAFSLTFHDELDRKHVFSGRSEEKVNQWVTALKESSYEFCRAQLLMLQMQLSSITGQDPLLMYHRSEGSKLPLPSKTSPKPETSSKVKAPKKTSFQSFVGSALQENQTSSMLNGLVFDDDHFGNGLQAIGTHAQSSLADTSVIAQAITQVEQTLLVPRNPQPSVPTSKKSESALVPTRVAPPPPPARPPRSSRQPPSNLIDL